MELLRFRPDRTDLPAVTLLYLLVVATFWLAFGAVGVDSPITLFLIFGVAGLLVLGVACPVVYTVWLRQRPLRALGVGRHAWKRSLGLGLLFGVLQYLITLYGYDFPQPVDWVPLLLMSLTVGLFESIFFRGFIQNRLEASFGLVPGMIGAAGLYSLYHVGYQMPAGEMAFLFVLGIIYAAIFRLTGNILVLWPFLTPIGAFYNNLEAGDIELPWISMLGFGEVLFVMGLVLFLAMRRSSRIDVRTAHA